jgi:hypothetical protein
MNVQRLEQDLLPTTALWIAEAPMVQAPTEAN